MSVRAFSDVVAGSTSVAFLKGGDRNPPLRFFQINTKISCGKSEEVLKIPENSPNKWNIKIREIVSNLSLSTERKYWTVLSANVCNICVSIQKLQYMICKKQSGRLRKLKFFSFFGKFALPEERGCEKFFVV